MVYISHLANVVILIAVCTALWRDDPAMAEAFGPDTVARRILGCVYATILLTSLYALLRAGLGAPQVAISIALVLFPLQIIYKLATVYAVGAANPVVVANLAVVALHCLTLATLAWRS